MPVQDEMELRRQKAVILWLTLLWLAAIAWFVTSYYATDLEGSRLPAKWRAVREACQLATLGYVPLLAAALWRWPAGRLALLIVSMAGTVFLGFLALAMGLLFAWVWNPVQYLCLLLGAFAVFRLMRKCQERIPDAGKNAGALPK